MKISFYQMNIKKKDVNYNLEKIIKALDGFKTDLIVLPELCFSGYYFQDKNELISLSSSEIVGSVYDELIKLCSRNSFFIVFGISEFYDNKLYNSGIVIGPNGLVGKHHKIHLSKNETVFDSGNELETFLINNTKIGINICYDIWFPEAIRQLMLKGSQIICCPCNFGGSWTLDIARIRAIENKVYVVVSNRIGYEQMENGEAHFRGESQVIDYEGNILVKAEYDEALLSVEINPDLAINKTTLMSNDILKEIKKYYKRYENIF